MNTETVLNLCYGITPKQFNNSQFVKKPYFWVLTIQHPQTKERRVVIAQWEPSNAKWYYPQPLEQREECGYTDHIWLGATDNRNWIIVNMRHALDFVRKD